VFTDLRPVTAIDDRVTFTFTAHILETRHRVPPAADEEDQQPP
jgi:hypothetical protein